VGRERPRPHHRRVGQPAAGGDLGYKRYLGTRRPQSTRWQVIVRNQVGVAWRGFWRWKIWLLGAAMTTVVFGALMFVSGNRVFGQLSARATGSATTFVDAMLPFSFSFYPWFGFVLSVSLAAAVVPRDLKAGAFEFYFSRPVRPLDYVLGKFVGLFLIMAAVMAAGPLLLALFRVGIAEPGEMLGLLDQVPRALAVGLLSSAAYAALPLAAGALVARPGHAIAAWVAFYLVASNIISGIAFATGRPILAVLDPADAVASLAFELFDVTFARGLSASGAVNAPVWASAGALIGYTVLALSITVWRVKRAERAGRGGG
jgi:ABC-2 type transport system permease protein